MLWLFYTHWIGVWKGIHDCIKNTCPCQELNPSHAYSYVTDSLQGYTTYESTLTTNLTTYNLQKQQHLTKDMQHK
jgi:hypothetical protein